MSRYKEVVEEVDPNELWEAVKSMVRKDKVLLLSLMSTKKALKVIEEHRKG